MEPAERDAADEIEWVHLRVQHLLEGLDLVQDDVGRPPKSRGMADQQAEVNVHR